MDSYVELFQSHERSLVLAKGTVARRSLTPVRYGGFYLGIGGRRLVWRGRTSRASNAWVPRVGYGGDMEISGSFPAFILVDDKGNDFYPDGEE